jgi:hypothetical protein
LLTDSDTPPCSDQLGDINAAHAKAKVAIATVLKVIFMPFLHRWPIPRLNDALGD